MFLFLAFAVLAIWLQAFAGLGSRSSAGGSLSVTVTPAMTPTFVVPNDVFSDPFSDLPGRFPMIGTGSSRDGFFDDFFNPVVVPTLPVSTPVPTPTPTLSLTPLVLVVTATIDSTLPTATPFVVTATPSPYMWSRYNYFTLTPYFRVYKLEPPR